MKIAIIDYESGNLKSVSKAVELASNNILNKSDAKIINSANELKNFDKIVLPGQGSFKQCYQSLLSIEGMIDELTSAVLEKRKPILGICVGMQLFSSFGEEDGGSKGFDWIKGKVKKINLTDKNLKLPHMGWNNISINQKSKLFSGIENESHFILFIALLLMLLMTNLFLLKLIIQLKLYLQLKRIIFLGLNFTQKKVRRMV